MHLLSKKVKDLIKTSAFPSSLMKCRTISKSNPHDSGLIIASAVSCRLCNGFDSFALGSGAVSVAMPIA
jgi:hypothetical protein